MTAWAVGLLFTLLIARIVRLQAEGLIAWILFTIVPYYVGTVILSLIGRM